MDSTTQLPGPVGGDAAAGSPVLRRDTGRGGGTGRVTGGCSETEWARARGHGIPAALPTHASQGGTRLG